MDGSGGKPQRPACIDETRALRAVVATPPGAASVLQVLHRRADGPGSTTTVTVGTQPHDVDSVLVGATPDALYEEVGIGMLRDVVQGYNCCLLSLGAARNGLPSLLFGDGAGFVRNLNKALCQRLREAPQRRGTVSRHIAARCSLFEVSEPQGHVRDLLPEDGSWSAPVLWTHPLRGSVVDGMSENRCDDWEFARDLEPALSRAAATRRSGVDTHVVYTITLYWTDLFVEEGGSGTVRHQVSTFGIYDIAQPAVPDGAPGLERLRTVVQGLAQIGRHEDRAAQDRLRAELGRTVKEGTLTYLLAEQLSGNCLTTAMACVAGDADRAKASVDLVSQTRAIRCMIRRSSTTHQVMTTSIQRQIREMEQTTGRADLERDIERRRDVVRLLQNFADRVTKAAPHIAVSMPPRPASPPPAQPPQQQPPQTSTPPTPPAPPPQQPPPPQRSDAGSNGGPPPPRRGGGSGSKRAARQGSSHLTSVPQPAVPRRSSGHSPTRTRPRRVDGPDADRAEAGAGRAEQACDAGGLTTVRRPAEKPAEQQIPSTSTSLRDHSALTAAAASGSLSMKRHHDDLRDEMTRLRRENDALTKQQLDDVRHRDLLERALGEARKENQRLAKELDAVAAADRASESPSNARAREAATAAARAAARDKVEGIRAALQAGFDKERNEWRRAEAVARSKEAERWEEAQRERDALRRDLEEKRAAMKEVLMERTLQSSEEQQRLAAQVEQLQTERRHLLALLREGKKQYDRLWRLCRRRGSVKQGQPQWKGGGTVASPSRRSRHTDFSALTTRSAETGDADWVDEESPRPARPNGKFVFARRPSLRPRAARRRWAPTTASSAAEVMSAAQSVGGLSQELLDIATQGQLNLAHVLDSVHEDRAPAKGEKKRPCSSWRCRQETQRLQHSFKPCICRRERDPRDASVTVTRYDPPAAADGGPRGQRAPQRGPRAVAVIDTRRVQQPGTRPADSDSSTLWRRAHSPPPVPAVPVPAVEARRQASTTPREQSQRPRADLAIAAKSLFDQSDLHRADTLPQRALSRLAGDSWNTPIGLRASSTG